MLIKDIECKFVGKKKTTLEPSKFFWTDPDTGQTSPMYDTSDAAQESAQAELRKRDETGAKLYVSQVVAVLESERAIKAVECTVGAKR